MVETDITLSLHLSEDDSATTARAILDIRGEHFQAAGSARRNPTDPPKPVVGEELAIARALALLESKLMEAAREKIERLVAVG